MNRRLVPALALLVAAIVSPPIALAADPTPKSPYDQGVDAYGRKDYVEARARWTETIEQGGKDEAFNNLGYLWHEGLGGPVDQARGIAYWRKGAVLGVSESQMHLGYTYMHAEGLPLDNVRAFGWLRCAIVTAHRLAATDKVQRSIEDDATKFLARLDDRISDDERQAGQKLADELVARFSVPISKTRP
jgi:hypothetical protein